MKQNVILKSIIRKPIIAILLTLLIGLISYGFVGKAAETIIVDRETTRLEGYYRSIGYITQENPDNEKNPYSAAVDLVQQNPELDYDDPQRQTAGFMRDFYNLDYLSGTMDAPETAYSNASSWAGEGVYNLDYWFYGRLIDLSKEYDTDKKIQTVSGYQLIFEVDQVLAGYPENISVGENYLFWIPARYALDYDKIAPQLEKIEEGERYLIHAWHHPSFNFGVTGLPIAVENSSKSFNLKAVEGDQWFIPLGASDSLDLTEPEYKNVRNQIDTLNQNLRSILLIGTSDMSALPGMQLDAKSNYLLEGRWLNHEDELTANKGIVIPKNLAEIRNIGMGDELAVTMRTLTNPYVCYIRGAEDSQNWEDYPSQEITYEVVGIYSNPSLDQGGDLGAFSAISYVPNSTFSDEYAFPTYYSKLKDKVTAYSFLLKNPRMQNEFEQDYAPKLKDLGFSLQFTDNNGKNFVAGADPMRKSNLIGSLLFGLALLMAIALSVFLYLRQQQRNFATMRALGVPAKKSNRQLIFPLLGLGFIGSALGAAFSWQNALTKAGESLSQLPLPSGVMPDLSLNAWLGVGLWLFVLLVLLFAVYIGNRKVSKTPVLELLQDSNKKTKAKNEEDKIEKDVPVEKALSSKEDTVISQSSASQIQVEELKKSVGPKTAIQRFSRANVLRSPLRSLLIIIVAAALLLALGWLQTLITANGQEIERLYESTEVQIDIGSGNTSSSRNNIPRKLVEWMQSQDFVERTYLSHLYTFRHEIDEKTLEPLGYPPYSILAINDLDESLKNLLIEYEIDFMDGYGPDDLSENWEGVKKGERDIPLIIPVDILEEQNWKLGDELEIELENVDGFVPFKIIGKSSGGRNQISRRQKANVGGVVKEVAYDYHYMISNLSALEEYYMGLPNYEEAFLFTKPSKNIELRTIKQEVAEKLPELAGPQVLVRFWDEELLAVVEPMEQNLSLMERLYPITMLISAVIGGVLSLLLVLNQAKETALLRMLGVEKGKIRVMQVKQILFLTLIGLLLGFGMLIALRGLGAAQPSVAIVAMVYLVGALLGALLGAIQVSNKKPMELLQVKE